MINKTLFYGYGLFDTFLYRGFTKNFERHLKRIRNSSLELFGIDIDTNSIKSNMLKQKPSNAYKILITYFGKEPFYKSPHTYKIRILRRSFKKPTIPISLGISSLKRHSKDITIYHKTTNYLLNVLAKQEAVKRGFFDGIFLNENNCIQECSTSNLLFVKNDKLFTPSFESGLLRGTTLMLLQEYFDIIQENITPNYLRDFDGVFALNSLMGAMPVSQIEDFYFKIHKDLERELNLCIEKDISS